MWSRAVSRLENCVWNNTCCGEYLDHRLLRFKRIYVCMYVSYIMYVGGTRITIGLLHIYTYTQSPSFHPASDCRTSTTVCVLLYTLVQYCTQDKTQPYAHWTFVLTYTGYQGSIALRPSSIVLKDRVQSTLGIW